MLLLSTQLYILSCFTIHGLFYYVTSFGPNQREHYIANKFPPMKLDFVCVGNRQSLKHKVSLIALQVQVSVTHFGQLISNQSHVDIFKIIVIFDGDQGQWVGCLVTQYYIRQLFQIRSCSFCQLISSYKCRVIVRHHRCAWFLGVAWLAQQGSAVDDVPPDSYVLRSMSRRPRSQLKFDQTWLILSLLAQVCFSLYCHALVFWSVFLPSLFAVVF